jgi:prepilin-type N-terminal cleavage/methylation domain-containing protein
MILIHPGQDIEMKRNGFTLIELIAVIAILGILITLGSKGLRSARISAKKAQAMVEMASIETAIQAYALKYGKLPAASLVTQGAADISFGYDESDSAAADSASIVSVLTMADDADPADNPAEVVFLEPQSGLAGDGTFRDPWGEQYRIALDTDYDGVLDVGGDIVRRKLAVVAVGLYRLKDSINTNDLIKSWQ